MFVLHKFDGSWRICIATSIPKSLTCYRDGGRKQVLDCIHPDIDQLKKTMRLTGTPGEELLSKITSDEVNLGLFQTRATPASNNFSTGSAPNM